MSLRQLHTERPRFYAGLEINPEMCAANLHSLVFVTALKDIWMNPTEQRLEAHFRPSLKRQGKENVKHKPAVENENLPRLKSSEVLAFGNPLSLLHNVWFHTPDFCSLISNWFDIREQAPGANLLHESVSGASSLVCTGLKVSSGPTGRNYAMIGWRLMRLQKTNLPFPATKSWPECAKQTTWTTATRS